MRWASNFSSSSSAEIARQVRMQQTFGGEGVVVSGCDVGARPCAGHRTSRARPWRCPSASSSRRCSRRAGPPASRGAPPRTSCERETTSLDTHPSSCSRETPLLDTHPWIVTNSQVFQASRGAPPQPSCERSRKRRLLDGCPQRPGSSLQNTSVVSGQRRTSHENETDAWCVRCPAANLLLTIM